MGDLSSREEYRGESPDKTASGLPGQAGRAKVLFGVPREEGPVAD